MDTPKPASRLGLWQIAALGGVLLLVGLLAAGLIRSGQARPDNGAAPDFALTLYPDHSGGYPSPLALSALRGKVVVVNFWASWCLPCRDEALLLQQAWQRYHDQGLVLVGVGYNDTEPNALAYLAEFDVTYPNGPDLRGVIGQRYRVQGVPETWFVDRAGQIVHVEIGPLTQEKLDAVLEPLMKD
jgi:cytochrome c biogenesis protein CcmG/thiol:disulfide interchange protein DsbE